MKRTIITSIILTAAVLTGCNRNELRPDGSEAQGELSLQIVPEGDFTPMSGTKATDDVQVDVNEFSLSINSAEGGTVMSWSKFSEVPAVIGLDPGTYTVIAKSPGNKSVDWLQPKYEGSQEVTVTPGDVENITISCSLTNMKVTIQTTEKFRNEMEDYTVTVSSDKGGFLTFTKAIIEEGRSGYFDPSLLTIDLNATRKQQEGVEIADPNVIQTMTTKTYAAKDHHIITLDASETGYANLSGGISVDYTVNNREEDLLVDGLEEAPVQDKPALSSSTIADGAEDVPVDTKTVGLTFTTNVKIAVEHGITLGEEHCEATVSGNVVTVTLPALTEGTQYTLNVPAGAVICDAGADESGEELAADALAITFTTASAEQEPDPEEPEEPEAPAITITATAGIDEPVTYSKSALPGEFDLTVTAPSGIEKYVVNVKSAGLRGLLDMMQMSYSVDLANMNAAEEGFWGSLFGITSADVKDKPEVVFHIAAFLEAMPEETNELEVVITDKEGNTETKTLTIIMEA